MLKRKRSLPNGQVQPGGTVQEIKVQVASFVGVSTSEFGGRGAEERPSLRLPGQLTHASTCA